MKLRLISMEVDLQKLAVGGRGRSLALALNGDTLCRQTINAYICHVNLVIPASAGWGMAASPFGTHRIAAHAL